METEGYASDRDAFDCNQQPDASLVLSVVVLGASGDLAKKKTYPALFALYAKGFLPVNCVIVGYARSTMTDEELRGRLKPFLKGEAGLVDSFLAMCSYVKGTYDGSQDFKNLHLLLLQREQEYTACPLGRLYYLALPPSVYPQVCTRLSTECNTTMRGPKLDESNWIRLIVEKPFGKDLQSSEELAETLGALYPETQLYRIDHYLGKELSQNMLVMRFANIFLQPIWNHNYISNIQITFKEPFGTEGRGGYFDQSGIIRDVIQNHLIQVMALLAMEKPVSLHPDDIRDEKTKVLRCVQPLEPADCVLGQYAAANGKPGYLDDETVPARSKTPTFAVCVLRVNNDRWAGVPFILKAGKALDQRKVDVRVQFKSMPAYSYSDQPEAMRNEFVMRLQPQEALYMKTVIKQPGLGMDTVMSDLDLSYSKRHTQQYIPDAYERLILDAVRGDQQHFVRRDELRAAWAIFTPLLHAIDRGELNPDPYPYGSRGPAAGDELVRAVGYVRTVQSKYRWGEDDKPAAA